MIYLYYIYYNYILFILYYIYIHHSRTFEVRRGGDIILLCKFIISPMNRNVEDIAHH